MVDKNQLHLFYQTYQYHYNTISQRIISQPQQNRSCTDIACTVIFIILAAMFFGIGVWQIVSFGHLQEGSKVSDGYEEAVQGQHGYQYLWIVAVGISCSIILSLLYILTVRMLHKSLIFILAITSMLILISIFIMGIISNNILVSIIMGIILLINSIFIYYIRKRVDFILELLKLCADFISQQYFIFIIPILQLISTCLITLFFIYSLTSTSQLIQHKQAIHQDTGLEQFVIGIDLFVYIVFIVVFYYFMCFGIGVECVEWYYGTGNRALKNGLLWGFSSFGAIVRAGSMLGVVGIANMIFSISRNQKPTSQNNAIKNKCHIACVLQSICKYTKSCLLQSCLMFLTNCFENMQTLSKVYNHYTIIMITVTGENYYNAAKSVMGLVWKQLDLLSDVNLICNYLIGWGLVITVGIPSIIAYLISQSRQGLANGQKENIITLVIVGSILVSIILLEVITQSLSSILILYLLDKNLYERKLIKNERMNKQTYQRINRFSTNPYGFSSELLPGLEGNYFRMKE